MIKMQMEPRQRPADWALEQFEKCVYAFVAMNGMDGTPYNIPMCVVVHNNAIYFHGALSGHKNDLLARDGRVCMSCVTYSQREPESYTVRFKSAMAFGKVSPVTEHEELLASMKSFNQKYIPDGNMEYATNRMASGHAQVYRLDIEEIVGKESRPGD